MHAHSPLPFICLFSLFNDIRSILDIQSHCVMGASPLVGTLFIHSHVTRYLVFWGGSSQRIVVGRHVAKGGGVMKLNG